MTEHITVSLTFDTEDYITPESDDAAYQLARILSTHGIVATFFVVGEKARALAHRKRRDVIAALSQHDIGYHTNLHSRHPTVAEYLERTRWSDGIEEVVRRESSGANVVRRTFEQELCGFATPGTSWGPQVAPACKLLGISSHIHSFTKASPLRSVHWFANTLCFHRGATIGPLDEVLFDGEGFTEFYRTLPRLLRTRAEEGIDFAQLFVGHPTCFVTKVYWDRLNFAGGENPADGKTLRVPPLRSAEEVQLALERFIQVIELLQNLPWVRLSPLRDVIREYTSQRRVFTSEEQLLSAAHLAYTTKDILTQTSWLSSADLLYLLTKKVINGGVAGCSPGGPLPSVNGPLQVPPPLRNRITIPWSTFIELCYYAYNYIEMFNTLPSVIHRAELAVPIGSLYRTLVAYYACQFPTTLQPAEIDLLPSESLPFIGREIADKLKERLPRWLHRPNLDSSNLVELAALQSWSIRSAIR